MLIEASREKEAKELKVTKDVLAVMKSKYDEMMEKDKKLGEDGVGKKGSGVAIAITPTITSTPVLPPLPPPPTAAPQTAGAQREGGCGGGCTHSPGHHTSSASSASI